MLFSFHSKSVSLDGIFSHSQAASSESTDQFSEKANYTDGNFTGVEVRFIVTDFALKPDLSTEICQ